MKKYNEKWQARIDACKTLPNSPDKFERVVIGETQIDVGGKLMDVTVERSINGHISIDIHHNNGAWLEGGWIYGGTVLEGYDCGNGLECEVNPWVE